MIIRFGSTRVVILFGSWAVKLPALWIAGARWKHFLKGLLANMREAEIGREGWPGLAPVLWAAPGGFVICMRRAAPLPRPQWDSFDFAAYVSAMTYRAYLDGLEPKLDSFGLIDGQLVAVDYG